MRSNSGFLVLTVAILGPLLLARVCPEQQFEPMAGLDQAKIATDPASGQKLLVKRLYTYTGNTLAVCGFACDPDNEDPNYPLQELHLWREPAHVAVPLDAQGNYQFAVSYPTAGWHYETLSLTDGLAVRTGTIAIHARVNRPPTIGCGTVR